MSNETKAVTVAPQQAVVKPTELSFTPEQVQVIKDTIAKGATDEELQYFLAVCEATGFDPFRREIHLVKRWSAKEQREVPTIQVGIDGLRGQAETTGQYAGQRGPFWCGPDGKWVDIWLKDEAPAAAKVEILRHGFTEPLVSTAKFSSYCQTFYNKETKRREPMGLWNTMPEGQLAKCAEALGLRRAFPRSLRGLYIAEELQQMDNDLPPQIQQQRVAQAALTAPETNVPAEIVQRIKDAAHKVNVSMTVANEFIAKLSEKWPNLDKKGQEQAVEDILSPWRERYQEIQQERKQASAAKKQAGEAPPKQEPPKPGKPGPPKAEPPKQSAPPASHVRNENPWVDVATNVKPEDYGAASQAVASQGDESMSAEEFTADDDDGFAEAQRLLGREPGDEDDYVVDDDIPF